MLRNTTNLLTKWNIRNNRKPLIVWGARQVGKTYLVKDIFAEEYYPDAYIYIEGAKHRMLYDGRMEQTVFTIIEQMLENKIF